MDNQRLMLFLGLTLVMMLLFEAWETKNNPPTEVVSESNVMPGVVPESGVTGVPGAVPDTVSDTTTVPAELPQITSAPATGGTAAVDVPQAMSASTQEPDNAAVVMAKSSQRIHIKTDTINVVLDTIGGDIRQVELIKYPVSVDKKDQPFVLMTDDLTRYFVAQTGLISKQGAPNHNSLYSVDKTQYQLMDGQDEIKVTLHWSGQNGIEVDKIYTFKRDSYVIDIAYVVKNNSVEPWNAGLYRQLQRTKVSEEGQSTFIYTFMGGVVSSTFNKYQKIEFTEMQEWKPEQSYIEGGWAAMLQHYFVASMIPEEKELNHYYTKAIDDTRFIIGMTTQEKSVAAGASLNFPVKFYVGPKDQHRMEKAATDLDRTVDYGVLWVLCKPIFLLLEWIHSIIGNWGWSIIVLTMMIKLVFYKLSEVSYKSMARMRKYQPKIAALRERFGSDRQRMSQALMELYKKEKINPLGGCLPMLVQIPVFIALYWVLLESIELRQASFIFWFDDLSTKDPYYVLPVLMGATMFFQQKLNPAPVDPMQQKIMMSLPFIFTLFFAFFPSGLVLYWIANNLLSISQQYVITKNIEKSDK